MSKLTDTGWGTFYTEAEIDQIRQHKKAAQAAAKAACEKRGIKLDPRIAEMKKGAR